MALAPADFYAYSRATGVPVPEDPEERAQLAPEVLEFRRNQLREPQEESNLPGVIGASLAGLGALGAGYLGMRRFGGQRAESQVNAPLNRAGIEDVERVVASGSSQQPAPSKLSAIPQATVNLSQQKTEPTLLGFLQDVREQEELRSIGRPTTPYRPGSLADRVAREQQQRIQAQLDSTNPETKTYVSKLNERRKARAAQAQELADAVRNALVSGQEQEGYDLSAPQVQTAGSAAASAFAEAEKRKQQRQPAPITRTWQNKLFDDRGMLRQNVISMHLGDENVIPKPVAQALISSAEIDNTGNVLGFKDSSAVFQATKYVREKLLANDYQNTIKNYLLSGSPGDIQPAQSRGLGWSAKTAAPTDVITIKTGEGGEQTLGVARRASAKFDVSDLEPLFLDPATNTLVRKSDIGTSGTPGAEAGTGIGEEIGQAVAFVPREEMSSFVSTPGLSGSAEAVLKQVDPYLNDDITESQYETKRYKQQGTDYAIGGLKEFGGQSESRQVSPETWQYVRQRRKELGLKPNETTPEIEEILQRARTSGPGERDTSLPVLSPEEHVQNKNVGISSNGSIFAKVKPVSLIGDPRLSKRLNQQYGNFFYNHPITGERWKSLDEASAFVNQVHSQFNETQLQQIQSQLETKEIYRGPMEVALSGTDTSGRQRKIWVDPYQKLSDIGEATLSSQLQDMLLQKGVIQETQTEEGAKYLRQTRYSVPELIDGQETKTWTLGPEHIGLFPSTAEKGKRNHYEYLNAVQNAYQKLTGNRLADLDLALNIRNTKGGQFLGGPSSNPYLNKALTVANTLTQISEPTRQRVLAPGATESLAERYGQGAKVSEKPSKTVPSRQRSVPLVSATFEPVYEWNPEKQVMEYYADRAVYNTIDRQVSPETIGAKRLSAALVDFRSRSGRPMKRSDFMQFASSIAQQEGADINELIKQTAVISRGAGEQAVTGRLMSQGRRALAAMDRPSPAEEVAQTIAEYDFGETVGSDIERAVQGPGVPLDVDMELTARQAQRAKVDPPGATETFNVDDQMLSNLMGRLRAQAGRRAGKRRSR